MTTRKFLIPLDNGVERWALLVEMNDESLNWARRARAAFEKLKKESDLPLEEIQFEWVWRPVHVIQDVALDEDTVEAVFYDMSAIMLGTDLDPATYRTIERRESLTVSVVSGGLYWSGLTEDGRFNTWSPLRWIEMGADAEDLLRCRYNDCSEAHPMAGESDLVTCHTCRRDMCLPIEEEDQ